MKLALLLLLISSAIFAQPVIISAPVEHLYVPTGFDSNDSVEVIVTGNFPNACYSRNNVEVKMMGDIIDIKVTSISPGKRLLTDRACPQMIVPFKEVVSIGNLQGGNYEVRVNQNSQSAISETLAIAEASSNSVDDNIYAAIEWVEKTSKNEVILHGWRYSDCMVLDQVKIASNNKDTLSVLPIMKQIREYCPMKGMPVSYPVRYDLGSLKMSKPLLHVRTMDGKSVNTIINLEE